MPQPRYHRFLAAVIAASSLAGSHALAATSWIGPTHAEMCFRQAKPEASGDAIEACTQAIRFGALTLSDLAATYNNRGIAFARAGKTRKALRDYRRSLEINPQSAHTWLNQANLYARTGKHERAMESYATAIEVSAHGWALPYFNRALTNLQHGDRVAARQDLLRAVDLEPHTLKYREVLAGTEFTRPDPPP